VINELSAITPLDGRYREKIAELSNYTSELALIKIRAEIEIKYLIAISEAGLIRRFSKKKRISLRIFIKILI
jgi:adenylosuccinate lyase